MTPIGDRPVSIRQIRNINIAITIGAVILLAVLAGKVWANIV